MITVKQSICATMLLSAPYSLLGCAGPELIDSEAGEFQVSAANTGEQGPQPANFVDTRFTQRTVDDAIPGPAFAHTADVNGDGQLDVIASAFGKSSGFGIPSGEVRIYQYDGDFDRWRHSNIVASEDGVYFPNHVTTADIDGDGDLDAFVPHGFLACTVPFVGPGNCGGLRWYENLGGADADRWQAHVIVDSGAPLFYHQVEFIDFDGDGIRDIVTVGEKKGGFFFDPDRAQAQWFKGTSGPERFETTPRIMGEGLGSIPTVRDIDGDGDLDVASAEFFAPGNDSFTWFERVADPSPANPAGLFERHVIDNDSGPSIMLTFVDDLYGDGILRAVGANHTNTAKFPADPWESAVFAFEVPADPRELWIKTQLSSGIQSRAGSPFAPQGAPGIFGTGDVDNDGDIDILLSGDGDPNVYWLEQLAPGDFETQLLVENMGQAGAMQVADLDGDGRSELLVSSYEEDRLLLLQFEAPF